MAKKRKRVVIIGAGFGGIHAAGAMSGSDFDVLILDRRNFHLFQPLLYQVATAALDQESIAYSIRAMVRKMRGVRYQMSEVTNVDFLKKEIATDDGPVSYDYLIVAAGSVTNFFGNEKLAKQCFDLKKLRDAVSLRDHVLEMFEDAVTEHDAAKRQAMLTFVIVGGGPTGVEFAGALRELIRNALTKDYLEVPVRQAKVVLVDPGDRLLKAYPPGLSSYAMRKLQRMGVELKMGHRVMDADEDEVFLKDGTTIPAKTLFWAAGVKAAPISDTLQCAKVNGGRVPVLPDLTVKDHPEVFVIGDMMYLEQNGQALPQVSQVAMQGGVYASKAIMAREKGQEVAPFSYFNKGSMAVIGRSSAVADVLGRVQFQGFAAWLAWLFIHIYYLIGFRNRLTTLISWAYTYLLSSSQVRLITRESRDPSS